MIDFCSQESKPLLLVEEAIDKIMTAVEAVKECEV